MSTIAVASQTSGVSIVCPTIQAQTKENIKVLKPYIVKDPKLNKNFLPKAL